MTKTAEVQYREHGQDHIVEVPDHIAKRSWRELLAWIQQNIAIEAEEIIKIDFEGETIQ